MTQFRCPSLCFLAALVATAPLMAQAPATVATARQLCNGAERSLLAVSGIAELSMGMAGQQQQERPIATTGFVLDGERGFVAVPWSTLDPLRGETRKFDVGTASEYELSWRLAKCSGRLPSGESVALEMMVTDAALDVAILRPVEPLPAKAGLQSASWSEPEALPTLLDEIIVLQRLDAAAEHLLAVNIVRAKAVRPTEGPVLTARPGSILFDAEGYLLGIATALQGPSDTVRAPHGIRAETECGVTSTRTLARLIAMVLEAAGQSGSERGASGTDRQARVPGGVKNDDEGFSMPLTAGAMAPDFELEDQSGTKHKLSSYRGKYVVLDWWGTWCRPCVATMPQVQELHSKYADDPRVVVLALNVGDGNAKMARYWKERGYTFPALNDADALVEEYGLVAYPTAYLIGPDGRILAFATASAHTLEPQLEKALGDEPPKGK